MLVSAMMAGLKGGLIFACPKLVLTGGPAATVARRGALARVATGARAAGGGGHGRHQRAPRARGPRVHGARADRVPATSQPGAAAPRAARGGVLCAASRGRQHVLLCQPQPLARRRHGGLRAAAHQHLWRQVGAALRGSKVATRSSYRLALRRCSVVSHCVGAVWRVQGRRLVVRRSTASQAAATRRPRSNSSVARASCIAPPPSSPPSRAAPSSTPQEAASTCGKRALTLPSPAQAPAAPRVSRPAFSHAYLLPPCHCCSWISRLGESWSVAASQCVCACAGHDLAESGALAQLAAALTLERGKDLLLFVMESAQRIALDPRPEVRTSGIKLLFDIMTRHSAALAGDEGRVWDMAFPLLMEVAKNVQLSNEAHAQSGRGVAPQVLPPPPLAQPLSARRHDRRRTPRGLRVSVHACVLCAHVLACARVCATRSVPRAGSRPRARGAPLARLAHQAVAGDAREGAARLDRVPEGDAAPAHAPALLRGRLDDARLGPARPHDDGQPTGRRRQPQGPLLPAPARFACCGARAAHGRGVERACRWRRRV